MVRDILIGAKQEDACQEYFDREAQTRTWCRETEQERYFLNTEGLHRCL